MTPENSQPQDASFSQREDYKHLTPISIREQAARVIDAFPIVPSPDRSDHTAILERSMELREELLTFLEQRPSEDELNDKLEDIYEVAKEAGMLNPLSNHDIYDELKVLYESQDYDEQQAAEKATRELTTDSYLPALRRERRFKEINFQEPITEAIAGELGPEEAIRLGELKDRSYDLASLTDEQRQSLAQDIPGGNYLYHGATTESLVKIIQTGQLMNYLGIYEREQRLAAQEGREEDHARRNSGFEGISWSMNTIDALPGDRYHMAGFLGAPESILSDNEQFAVPSRPAPHEVIQIAGEINANAYYENKVQYELISDVGMGESNSVFGSLIALEMALNYYRTAGYEPGEAPYMDEPMMLSLINDNSDQEIAEKIKDKYHLDEQGGIVFSLSLAEQRSDNAIPVLAVYLQALIDTGRVQNLEGFKPAPQSVREFVEAMTEANIESIVDEARADRKRLQQEVQDDDERIEAMGVDVKDMYFVCPQKDAIKWQLVFAKSGNMPKGILMYDGKKVRLENFASDVTGDAAELSIELRGALPATEGYIDYEKEVLGTQITPDVRAGSRHHVIAEDHLVNRKVIRRAPEGTIKVVES